MSPPEIIELHPQPRVDLVVVLRLDPHSAAVAVALATARFLSALQAADRKLRLKVDPVRSRAEGNEVTLVLTPRFRAPKAGSDWRNWRGWSGT